MDYLKSKFSVSGPSRVFGCPACIYPASPDLKHSRDEHCAKRLPRCPLCDSSNIAYWDDPVICSGHCYSCGCNADWEEFN